MPCTCLNGGGCGCIEGGEAIASGTYGCVFRPALACWGSGRQSGAVSKLMTEEDALNEFNESALVRAAMESMQPHDTDLFIIPLAPPCMPWGVTMEDLKHADTVCRSFSNLQTRMSGLRVLTQKDGGQTLAKLDLTSVDGATAALVMNGMADLIDALHQLNLRGVIHGDVKAMNLVVSDRVRLIDWGFTRSLHGEYSGEFAKRYSFKVIMFNCMPSMWVYNMFATRSKRHKSRSIAEVIHVELQAVANANQHHLRALDKTFIACNAARQVHGMRPIQYGMLRDEDGNALDPIYFADGTQLSQESTEILVAHGVAVFMAIFLPHADPIDRWARFYTLVDLVVRVNLDVYGVLSFAEDVADIKDSAPETQRVRRDFILASLSPYLLSAAYAVKPFNLEEIKSVLRAMPGAARPPVPVDIAPFEVSAVNFSALEALVDPTHGRAFSSERYIGARRAKENVTLTKDEELDAVRRAMHGAATGARSVTTSVASAEAGGASMSVPFVSASVTTKRAFTPPDDVDMPAVVDSPLRFVVAAPESRAPPPPPARPGKRIRRRVFGGSHLSGGVRLALYRTSVMS